MKYLFILFYSFSALLAQDVKQIEDRKTMEITNVLSDNKKIKHGDYTRFYEYPKRKNKRRLKITGSYLNNKKDSVWNYYSFDGSLFKSGRYKDGSKDGVWKQFYWGDNNLSSIGRYQNGKKIGSWKYYNESNVMIHEFDHTKNEVIFYTKNEMANSEQPNDLRRDRDSKGFILGGERAFKKYVSIEFEYPKEASLNGISGRVIVSFHLDEDFIKTDFHVQNDLGYGLAEEAIRLVREGPLWIPPRENGVFIGTSCSIPIVSLMY